LAFRFLGEGTQKKRLMKRVEQEQIKNVSFEAPVPKAAIYMKLQEADAFIATAQALPLYELGISFNKLFDYMASARPIIFGGLAPNAATEANAALAADVRDPYELARAILYIRDMPELERWQMGLRAREHVEKFYSIENLAARLEAVLADAVTAAAARFEVEPTTPLPALK
jgi:glycosyltransferase involved in cell wall biosynthesis